MRTKFKFVLVLNSRKPAFFLKPAKKVEGLCDDIITKIFANLKTLRYNLDTTNVQNFSFVAYSSNELKVGDFPGPLLPKTGLI